ncbi:uncharacterized protein LOC115626102 [Scaptodrosophila lebanonensis]|uniref:Uncharacterized protein LOC115626102 n=1 Tax=Drosophila lebanonensis TaxID=7225 RepID=A0A6J2TMD5_DROLE|nr:uncharacterized protein LOC115626102 [Scaptodrosophila lebanonensis]
MHSKQRRKDRRKSVLDDSRSRQFAIRGMKTSSFSIHKDKDKVNESKGVAFNTETQSQKEKGLPQIAFTFRSNIRLDLDTVDELSAKWKQHFNNVSQTPLELKLAAIRAQREHKTADPKKKTEESVKKRSQERRRPITALYTAPRTTQRMKKVIETKMPCSNEDVRRGAKDEDGEYHYNLCRECGFVKCTLTPAEHAERLRKKFDDFIAKNPALRPETVAKRFGNKRKLTYITL